MGNYGVVSLKAADLIRNGQVNDPADAWEIEASKQFGKGSSSQEKSCPKDSFLGLCEDGLIKGVNKGDYTQSVKNKLYAITAIKLLKAKPSLANLGERGLWKKVLKHLNKPVDKAYNNQMDVVLTLSNNHLIK